MSSGYCMSMHACVGIHTYMSDVEVKCMINDTKKHVMYVPRFLLPAGTTTPESRP
jgi:hypothetical protein